MLSSIILKIRGKINLAEQQPEKLKNFLNELVVPQNRKPGAYRSSTPTRTPAKTFETPDQFTTGKSIIRQTYLFNLIPFSIYRWTVLNWAVYRWAIFLAPSWI